MAMEVVVNREGLHRIVLEQYPEGVYVYVWFREDGPGPERDYLQDTVEQAKGFCTRNYGVDSESWKPIPDTCLHGPHDREQRQ